MSEVAAAASVAFGLSAGRVATLVFALSYVLIVSERLNRSIIALLGASAMIVVGVLSQDEAIRGIDFNTIALRWCWYRSRAAAACSSSCTASMSRACSASRLISVAVSHVYLWLRYL